MKKRVSPRQAGVVGIWLHEDSRQSASRSDWSVSPASCEAALLKAAVNPDKYVASDIPPVVH
eukprot:3982410-Alexandrium_andersonii.AAC.1